MHQPYPTAAITLVAIDRSRWSRSIVASGRDHRSAEPALKALPETPYVFAEWRIRRVSIDYHVDVEKHYYSVPHRFARAEVEVRFTARTLEIFHKGERIAAHQRMSGNHKHTTVPEHMASSHRRYAGWTVARIRQDAATIGPATTALCNLILDERPHPEQGFRACLGILRLARSYGGDRLEAAATRAIDIGARTYGSRTPTLSPTRPIFLP